MQLGDDGRFHLTYCTNIHAADGWDAVEANVRRFAPELKRRLAPDAPFGLGLRLSARDATELLDRDRLSEFRSHLDAEGLYVALINGFPHGSFHRTPVKADVYAPDWRDDARVRYTLNLIAILARLMPDGLDGGVSTAPLSYKSWPGAASPNASVTYVRNIVRIAEALVRLREHTGKLIHLDIEPEPDCVIETSRELVEFFEQRLIPDGAPLLASALDCGVASARRHLYDHVRVCFDCCHFAVEYEQPAEALSRIREAGIQVGRVQLSSALTVVFPGEAAQADAFRQRLRRFADTTYLHQVIERAGATLRHFADLNEALDAGPAASGAEWRIHFHVPLFAADYDGLGSTQDYVRTIIGIGRESGVTRHFEIETYTWDVLPHGLKFDLLESIGREYEWVIREFGQETRLNPSPLLPNR